MLGRKRTRRKARALGAIAAPNKRVSSSHLISLPSRQVTDHTPGDVAAAINAATGGSYAMAADLVKDIWRDDRVHGVLQTRTLGMIGLPLSWEGPVPEDWHKLAPEAELNKLLAWGLLAGIGIAQILPDGSLETWHLRHLREDVNERRYFVMTSTGEVEIEPGNGWVIFTPYGSLEAIFEGLWTALALPFLVKRFALHDRARASEVFGSAMIVGKTDGASEEQRRQWLADLQGLSRSSRIVLPEGYDVDLLEAQGQTWGIYKQSADWADTAITIAIAGQIVTTMGQSGFSKGDIHETIAHSLIKFGAEAFASCLGEQYIPAVWGEQSFPVWKIKRPTADKEASENLAAFGTAVSTANKAVYDYGLRVDVRAMAEEHSIPLRRRVDESATITIAFAPTDIAKMVTLNEGRANIGLGPLLTADGEADPRGEMLLALVEGGDEIAAAMAANQGRLIAASSRAQGARVCRAIDVSKAPKEFRVFERGKNETDHGPAYLTAKGLASVIKARGDRDVMIDLEHLSLDAESAAYDPNAYGWAKLEARDGELWAVDVRWTDEGRARIESKKQRYVSPTFWTTKKGEIVKLLNIALTALPAMHNTPALIAASSKGNRMDPELLEALGLGADATLADVLQAIADLQREAAAVAEAAGDSDAADAIDEAADASEDAADAAEDVEEMAAEEDEDAEKASADTDDEEKKAAKTLSSAMAKRLSAVEKRLADSEKARLMATRAFTPAERKWLMTQSVKTVRSYAAIKPLAKKPPAKSSAKPGELTPEEIAICNAARIDVEKFKAHKAKAAK